MSQQQQNSSDKSLKNNIQQPSKEVKQQNIQLAHQQSIQRDSSKFQSSSLSQQQSSQNQSSIVNTHKIYKNNLYKTSYRRYSRITPQIKQKLIKLIVRENLSIKNAADSLKINYSSAKFIFSQYRSKNLHIIDKEIHKEEIIKGKVVFRKFKSNQQRQQNQILIRSTSGGKFICQSGKMYSVQEFFDSQRKTLGFQTEKVES